MIVLPSYPVNALGLSVVMLHPTHSQVRFVLAEPGYGGLCGPVRSQCFCAAHDADDCSSSFGGIGLALGGKAVVRFRWQYEAGSIQIGG